MQIELTDEEAYVAEKILDRARDEMLMGMAQLARIAIQSQSFDKFYSKMTDEMIHSFELHNSICKKFGTARVSKQVMPHR